MVGQEYDKARPGTKPGTTIRSAQVGMAASNTYVFFTEVLPRAIKKCGGIDVDALRKAALEGDLPEGGTMLGFGVKFAGEGSPVGGQNLRAFPVITQYIDDKILRGVAEEPSPAPGGSPVATRHDLFAKVRSDIRKKTTAA